MQRHEFIIDKVKLGGKGQITIPKRIRDEDSLKKDDEFNVTHTPSGSIILEKSTTKKPEDRLFEFLNSLPYFDAEKAWKEVEQERRKEHR